MWIIWFILSYFGWRNDITSSWQNIYIWKFLSTENICIALSCNRMPINKYGKFFNGPTMLREGSGRSIQLQSHLSVAFHYPKKLPVKNNSSSWYPIHPPMKTFWDTIWAIIGCRSIWRDLNHPVGPWQMWTFRYDLSDPFKLWRFTLRNVGGEHVTFLLHGN